MAANVLSMLCNGLAGPLINSEKGSSVPLLGRAAHFARDDPHRPIFAAVLIGSLRCCLRNRIEGTIGLLPPSPSPE